MLYRRRIWITVLLLAFTVSLLAACHGEEHGANSQAALIDESTDRQIDPHRLEQLKVLDETADKLYSEVMNGDIVQAREHIRKLSDHVMEIEFSGITTVEGVEALTAVIVNAKELMNAMQTEPDRLQAAAAQVRLSTDALVHTRHPLWFEYYRTIDADMKQLRSAIEQGQNILLSAQQLYRHYSIIRPAILISRSPETIVEIESMIAFFMQQSNHPDARLQEMAQQLSRKWDELFEREDVSAYLPVIDGQQPIYWSLVIGSLIITVLCFVAWRKYQGERMVSVYGPYKDE